VNGGGMGRRVEVVIDDGGVGVIREWCTWNERE